MFQQMFYSFVKLVYHFCLIVLFKLKHQLIEMDPDYEQRLLRQVNGMKTPTKDRRASPVVRHLIYVCSIPCPVFSLESQIAQELHANALLLVLEYQY